MSEIIEGQERSEVSVEETSNEDTLLQEIATTAEPLEPLEESDSLFLALLDETSAESEPESLERAEKTDELTIEERSAALLKAIEDQKPYFEYLKDLTDSEFEALQQELEKTIVSDLKDEGELTYFKIARANLYLQVSGGTDKIDNKDILNYLNRIEVKEVLDNLERGHHGGAGPGSLHVSDAAKPLVLKSLIGDIEEHIKNPDTTEEFSYAKLEFILMNTTTEERGKFPEEVRSYINNAQAIDIAQSLVFSESNGYGNQGYLDTLPAELKKLTLEKIKENLVQNLSDGKEEKALLESRARILKEYTTEKERKTWPEELRNFVETPYHYYSVFSAEEQLDVMYTDIEIGYSGEEFRKRFAHVPKEQREELLERLLKEFDGFSKDTSIWPHDEKEKLEGIENLMRLNGADYSAISEQRDKLEMILVKGFIERRSEITYVNKNDWPGLGATFYLDKALQEIELYNSSEAKDRVYTYLQDMDMRFVGNTKELESELKDLTAIEAHVAGTVKPPESIVLSDEKTTLKDYLLKQSGVTESDDGSFQVKDKDGNLYKITASVIRDNIFIRVKSTKDPLTMKVLEFNEFEARMGKDGISGIIKDARQSRKEELAHKDTLSKYDLPMDEKTAVIRTMPRVPDHVIKPSFESGIHMATALRARYGEAVDIKPVTFGKDMMLAQIDEAYKEGTKSFFVNVYGHGSMNGMIHTDSSKGFAASDIKALLEKYPDAHFIVTTNGCYGGGLMPGMEDTLKANPDLSNRLILMTEIKPDIVSYGGSLGGTYEAHFIKSIYSGDTFGEAIRKADLENKKQSSQDADTLIHGVKVGVREPVRSEDLLS